MTKFRINKTHVGNVQLGKTLVSPQEIGLSVGLGENEFGSFSLALEKPTFQILSFYFSLKSPLQDKTDILFFSRLIRQGL